MRQPRASALTLTFAMLAVTLTASLQLAQPRAAAPVEVPGLKGAIYEPAQWSGSPQFQAQPRTTSDYI